MITNSSIFTDTIFGTSSGKTAAELTGKNSDTQEKYLNQTPESKMNYKIPTVPSNQGIAKDKK